MVGKETAVVALLPIYPVFANRILNGYKKVEFRRTIAARPITHVLIYSTAPNHQVVGYFEVLSIDSGHPSEIWSKYKTQGGVSQVEFEKYYQGSLKAMAIRIGRVVKLSQPLSLQELSRDLKPPQGLRYVQASIISQLIKQDSRP